MANFSRANPTGWGSGDLLTAAQMNTIDSILPKVPNFEAGSTHNPTAFVSIGGTGSSGLQLTGAYHQVTGTLTFSATATLAFLTGGTLSGNIAGSPVFTGSPEIGGTLNVNNGGKVDYRSGATMEVSSGATATVLNGGTLSMSGGSHWRLGTTTGSDADVNLQVGVDGPVIFVPNVSTGRTWTLLTSGASAGSTFMLVSQQSTTNQVTITDGTYSMVMSTATGDYQGGLAVYDGTNWRFVRGHQH